MQNPVQERVQKLREEITNISLTNRMFVDGYFKGSAAAADHQRRFERLREILAELEAMKEWKAT